MKLKSVMWLGALMAPAMMIAQPPPQQYPPPQGQYPPAGAPAGQYPAPAPMPPGQIDQVVSKIALYPDPLLSQVLAASTYPPALSVRPASRIPI